MKNSKANWLALALLAGALTVGCSPMRYSEFAGRANSWPTAAGSMAERQFAVPVYRGWPERPYRVIGSVRFEDPDKYWDDGVIAMAARTAKGKGGDAIVMRSGSEFGVGITTGAIGDPKVISNSQSTALVIQWKSQSEVAQERALVDRLVEGFRQRHADSNVKREVASLAADYVRWLGLDLNSPAAAAKLDEVLQELAQPADNRGVRWLFRGHVRATSITTSASDTVYGVATVQRGGDALTIVSTSENSELNFSGTLQDGRIAGQLGFSAGSTIISAKAEGVYTDAKISLTGQGHTADGSFQGSFSFSR